jgi:hypothetical protein
MGLLGWRRLVVDKSSGTEYSALAEVFVNLESGGAFCFRLMRMRDLG